MKLHDLLDYHARQFPNRVLAHFEKDSITYAEAAAQSQRMAQALCASGLEVGDRFAFLAENCLEYAYLFFAASRVGAVPVPLNYRLAPPELAYIIRDSEAKLVAAQPAYTEVLESVRQELEAVRHWVQIGQEAAPGWQGLDDWLLSGHASPSERESDADADVYQMYTSGTTGHPKGVIITQRALLDQIQQLANAMDLRQGDRVLTVAPMYHAAATVTALGAVAQGGTLVIHQSFDPEAVVRALSEQGISRTTLVPAMIQACLQLVPDVGERRYDDLRLIMYGASPIAETTLRRAIEVFGCDFYQGFGMTETTAALTLLTPEDHRLALSSRPELLLSAGRPLPGTRIKIVDESKTPVAPGTIGEIAGSGPQLMRGYWNLPEATEEALQAGWMHTGDAGRVDDDGYLYIEDRLKDMIVSGGENVYPREIENVLFEHPAIEDCAVIGVPSEKWGEEAKAVVVLADGCELSAVELIEFCRGKLAGYKLPRSVDFVESIPRNASGKALKRELREKYWAGKTRRVS